MKTTRSVLVALALVGLTAAACTNDTADQIAGGSPMPGTPDPSGVLSREKPEIEIPEGDPPAELQIEDLIEGNGEVVEEGDNVVAHYVGVSWSNGEQFDSSWDRGQPITFPLQGVIPGWQEGIPGMKVGGRRHLVIPPDLAYGENPPPGSGIQPGETLVFVVDLVDIAAAQQGPQQPQQP